MVMLFKKLKSITILLIILIGNLLKHKFTPAVLVNSVITYYVYISNLPVVLAAVAAGSAFVLPTKCLQFSVIFTQVKSISLIYYNTDTFSTV